MRVQYATIVSRSASLNSEFGHKMMLAHFGEEATQLIYEIIGVYQRGPRKGQRKGWIHWRKCEVGGWVRTFGGGGYVQRPGKAFDFVVALERYDDPFFEQNGHDLFWEAARWGADIESEGWRDMVRMMAEKAKDKLEKRKRSRRYGYRTY